MTPDLPEPPRPPTADPAGGSGDDADLGPPVAELAALSWTPKGNFSQRVRGRIERRLVTGEFLELAWTAPLMVLLEMLRAPFELLTRGRRQ